MKYTSPATQCVHSGTATDPVTKGVNTPVYTSTAFAYLNQPRHMYPRYFNTPNQRAVIEKICALEKTEAGLLFGSGMAAISTALLSLLNRGDHIIFPREIYGGTQYLANHELTRWGIEFSLAGGNGVEDFAKEMRPNTRAIYLETPSNPLLSITDLEAMGKLAKSKGLISFIDNTFASPINQNPVEYGIDVIMHSGTKYLGGHSDISCGVITGSHAMIDVIHKSAICFGGNMNADTVALLERSMKTLQLRVSRQNENALAIARALQSHPGISRIFYPGLESHPDHAIARKQMKGFGGMLSFELREADPQAFLDSLHLIKPAMSLGGVESTVVQPSDTSHSKITEEERQALGITPRVMRLSVGIEEVTDLIADIENALVGAQARVNQTIEDKALNAL